MTTKTYLQQIERIEILIRNKRKELERLRESSGNHAIRYDRERVQSSNISDPTARAGTEFAMIAKQIESWITKRQKIIGQIDSMRDKRLYEVLTYRYVQMKSMYELAEMMNVGERQAHSLLKKAHEKFEELHGDTYLDS